MSLRWRRWLVMARTARNGSLSLRLRLMLGATGLAFLFMLALLPVLQAAFSLAFERVIEERLAADANTLITASRIQAGQLLMPERLPDEEFDLPDARLLGYIYDPQGKRLWQSRSAEDESIDYQPRLRGDVTEFLRVRDAEGAEYFVYDVELRLNNDQRQAFSFVTMQPTSEYRSLFEEFRRQLYLWLGGGLLVLLTLLWLGLTWGFRSLKRLSHELDQVEAGRLDRLSDQHPRELLRLTRSLNRLLDGERRQREQYRNSLGDLAHSLKTPLTVLQSVGEVISNQPHNRDQSRVMRDQIERMSQQIGYQLQRASLGQSGLVRHRVALQPLLVRLCSTLDKVYQDKRVQVELQLPANATLPLEQGALMELLGNLLENAYRLCLHQVRISLQHVDEQLILSVEDDGPGVPADQRARILRRGERLDAQHPGQGIGLAVVKDIIDSYGGELRLDDSDLGGAAFRLHLPLD
ncbi:MAG: GHKL domain-containing protein [Gammaproteobacteria bacterium]|uniref:ATP-binding protein n=1 Tax=Stutzerimonas xanthomarina TaxID=271420 RepID=UPI0019098240|nr:ATP-binding protein [Stutzerimonas xanthomarina]MBU0811308.1 GHKL domain-containing protein [Gammaproteobacteria bacterium]MBK3844848.1 HAMP domain-containing protein [Stutzerimonas xanthomarina]MBU0852789.1 GHKL domain-containing protein [Gammaproteobacteria bacterium]MBU1303022.1 GHKL domain-containing protein [Gammaproteobacteria bacterium]MBU1459430.1 GHKL domain-containing protein [Gammaproteobacteria bacterium]